ncbi:hypothetical protein ACXR2U_04855 [Jatrophihabitans sp. YIM 134969]
MNDRIDTGVFGTDLRPMTPQEAARYASQRERWADYPDILTELDVDMRRQLSRPAPPPCPEWCTERNHDGYEDFTDGTGRQMRSHVLEVSLGVSLVVEEYRDAADVVTLGDPFIVAETPTGYAMSAQQAQEMGEGLLRAVARLGEIGGAA